MRQQVPAKRMNVLPLRVARVNEEGLVVNQNVGEHESKKSGQDVFWTEPGIGWQRDGGGGQEFLPGRRRVAELYNNLLDFSEQSGLLERWAAGSVGPNRSA